MRSDYNGVLLLDTILQIPVSKADDVVKLELLLSEVCNIINEELVEVITFYMLDKVRGNTG